MACETITSQHLSQDLSLEAACERCLQFAKESGYRELSLRNFRSSFNSFINWCAMQGIFLLQDVDIVALKKYFLHLKQRQLSGYTVKNRRNCLRYLLKYLKEKGLIAENPMEDLQIRPRIVEKPVQALTINEMRALLEEAEKYYQSVDNTKLKRIALRDKLILEFLLATGMRACEIAALKIKDVDLERGLVHIRGKGSNWYVKRNRLAFIDEEHLITDLACYIQGKSPENVLFENRYGDHLSSSRITAIIQRIAKRAGLKRKVNCHLLRHSFCSFLITQGADVFSVQRLMGHWQVETTLHFYLHLTSSELKENWQQHNPLAGGENA